MHNYRQKRNDIHDKLKNNTKLFSDKFEKYDRQIKNYDDILRKHEKNKNSPLNWKKK